MEPVNRRERRHPELVGIPKSAEILGVDARTVRRYIASGKLPAVRVGPRLIKIDVADLEALLVPVGGAA
jgi:excisionase family DNA binding protein